MKDLVQRVAICPRENVEREFKLVDSPLRQYGTMYECTICGQMVNEMYIIFEERRTKVNNTPQNRK